MPSNDYNYLVLGEGNPLHPANCEVGSRFASHDLKESLDYFYASKEPEALELAIDFHTDKLLKAEQAIIELIHLSRGLHNDLIANKLCIIRDLIKEC